MTLRGSKNQSILLRIAPESLDCGLLAKDVEFRLKCKFMGVLGRRDK